MTDKTALKVEENVARKAAEMIVSWRTKMNFLKGQIDVLGKLSNFPIIAISVFLLKAQLIEFEIKQLITEIDLHLGFSNNSRLIRRKTLKPIDMERWTLGQLRDHLMRYDSRVLTTLQQELKGLNDLRRQFAHSLFGSSKDVNSLTKDSEKAIPLANKVLDQIERVKKALKDNDPLKAFTKNKRSIKN